MKSALVWSRRFAGLVLSLGLVGALLVGCEYAVPSPNGETCTKNDDCESKHCVSNVCRPMPKFGGPAPAPTSSGAPNELAPRPLLQGILLTVAYDGRPFSGWAPQKNARTVAGELLAAIQQMRPSVVDLRGASRTDAGVHARGQRAAFDVEAGIAPIQWARGLGAKLPPEISVRSAAIVAPGFAPRFHARGKRYLYTLLCDPLRDPFLEGRSFRIPPPFAIELARREAATILGEHDFRAFRSSADARANTTRTLSRVSLDTDPHDPRVITIAVEGSGFMHNMVRIIAGTLSDIGLGRLAPGAFARALATGQRSTLGRTAPAEGLLLDEIFLDDEGSERYPTTPA